jgi:hypothetical protein
MKKLLLLLLLANWANAQFFNTANGELAYKLYTTSGAFTTNVVYLVFNERLTKDQATEFETEFSKLTESQRYKFAQAAGMKGFRIETEVLDSFYEDEPTFSNETKTWEGHLKPIPKNVNPIVPINELPERSPILKRR